MIFKESESVELKATYVPDLKKEIVAFANTDGGTIYVGVSDDGAIVGLENSDLTMQQLANIARDGIRPDIAMFTHIELLYEGTLHYVKMTVGQGTKRPYYLSDKGLRPSGVYVRQGTSSAPASEDAIREMIKLTDGDSFESNRSLIQELTFDILGVQMRDRNLDFGIVQQKNIGIFSGDDLYTNLGLLVSDQCKHSIKLAVFQGTDKLIFKDRKEFGGSLFKQLQDAYNMIEFYNGTRATFHQLLRSDERDYPEDAIREALLNAIVHRDYSFSGNTFINLYSDRIEFVSLGGLVFGLSLNAVMLGASQARNEKLAALFYRMRLIEAYGTGIGKILSCYNGAARQPVFESADGAFRVTLPNLHTETPAVNVSHNEIVDFVKEHGSASRKDIEVIMGVGTTRAINILKKMTTENILHKTGDGKQTRYILK